jgi:hypothetical protein
VFGDEVGREFCASNCFVPTSPASSGISEGSG